jgi:hypothetical protein
MTLVNGARTTTVFPLIERLCPNITSGWLARRQSCDLLTDGPESSEDVSAAIAPTTTVATWPHAIAPPLVRAKMNAEPMANDDYVVAD